MSLQSVLFRLVNVLACDKTCLTLILIVPKTDISSLEGFMGPSCTFCNEPKQISSHLVFYTIGHQPLCNDMVDPNTQPKRKLSTYFLIFAGNTNLKKNILNGANPFKEQEDLPDSWSILIERAGLWGAESSLRE